MKNKIAFSFLLLFGFGMAFVAVRAVVLDNSADSVLYQDMTYDQAADSGLSIAYEAANTQYAADSLESAKIVARTQHVADSLNALSTR
jgi:hypothetical protein